MTVYLLHFDEPIGDLGNPHGQAQHYIGWADDVGARLAEHAKGNGAAIMRAVEENGIGWRCVRTWQGGDRRLERRIKNRHEGPRLCPVCGGPGALRRARYEKEQGR